MVPYRKPMAGVGGKQDSWLLNASVYFLSGLLLGSGLVVGGVTDSRTPNGMMNLNLLGTPHWNPALLVLFMTALSISLLTSQVIKPMLNKPLLASSFNIPTNTKVDARLVVGCVLFGLGWALSGLCPGPAVVAASSGDMDILQLFAFMLLGMCLAKMMLVRGESNKMAKFTAYKMTILTLALCLIVVLYDDTQAQGSGMGGVGSRLAESEFMRNLRGGSFPPDRNLLHPLVGGVLVGCSVAGMLLSIGEILGVSGIISGLYSTQTSLSSKLQRLLFVAGLFTAGILVPYMIGASPSAVSATTSSVAPIRNYWKRPRILYIISGLLVGFGTCLGSGCTSGHGLAGLSRISKRSIVAVALFFGTNMLVSSLAFTLVGYGSEWHTSSV